VINDNFLKIKLALILTPIMMHPHILEKLKCESKSGNIRKRKSWGMLFNLQHFEGKKACWSFGMGTRTNDKWVTYSHKLAQTKQQVG